jgi:hypothetical protein
LGDDRPFHFIASYPHQSGRLHEQAGMFPFCPHQRFDGLINLVTELVATDNNLR